MVVAVSIDEAITKVIRHSADSDPYKKTALPRAFSDKKQKGKGGDHE